MAAPASSSSSSSSSSAASKHAALAFFDSHPTSFPNLLARADEATWQAGRAQLASSIGVEVSTLISQLEAAPDSIAASASSASSAAKGWLPSASSEQSEVSAFLAWASGAAKDLVRQVVEELPSAVFAEHAELIARAELIDLSPKGRVDDEVFAQHRDVWERITRGCAVIRLTPTAAAGAGAAPLVRWAVRANRKFTGHEDENNVPLDGKLYVVDHGAGPATQVVVSHKCNGSVLHLAARDIVLWGAAAPSRWVFLGSKKVHVGAVWNSSGGVQDWLSKMGCFRAARHEVVSEMVSFIAPKLASKGELILASLARWRLVINAEYVSSIGTGPTDNQRIYGLAAEARESFGFMLTSNSLTPLGGMELGLDFMYGLKLLASWGFATVSAFLIPLSDLPQAKAAVIPLADIEGAVLYYADARGQILSLEKWKSSNYVIVRAVREKLRPFIFGGRNNAKGIEELMAANEAEAAASALKVAKVALTPQQLQVSNLSAKDAKGAAAAAKKVAKKQEKAEKAAAAAAAAPAGQKGQQKGQQQKGAQRQKNAQQNAGAGASVAAANEAMESLQINDDEEQNNDAAAASSASAASAASSSPAAAAAGSSFFLEFSHPEMDALGSALTELGGSKVREGLWRVACPSDAGAESALRARVAEAYRSAVLQKPFAHALTKVTERVQGRIKSIDHIPLSDAERDAWLRDSALFLAWLMEQLVVHKRWQPKEVMAQYSQMWSIFRDEQMQKQQASAASKQ